jgi:predicted ATPase
MQGKLRVKNFGVLKDIEININDFTVIIGSQGEGKSLIAKLVHFFRSFFRIMISTVFSEKTFKTNIIKEFTEFFPPYIIEQFDDFVIEYFFPKYEDPFVIKKKTSEQKMFLKIHEPKNMKIDLDVLKQKIIEFKENYHKSGRGLPPYIFNQPIYQAALIESLARLYSIDERSNLKKSKKDESNYHLPFPFQSIFIPSGRAAITYLQQNIFSIMTAKVQVDKLLLEYGTTLESDFSIDDTLTKILVQDLFKELKIDDYRFEENERWVITKGQRIKIANASSGQQEAIPMILTILMYSVASEGDIKNIIIIEEPEAHLFPSTQQKFMEFLCTQYNFEWTSNKFTGFFITTHSPYILSSLNNFIQANNTYETMKKKRKVKSGKDKLRDIIHANLWLKFDSISAYLISDGKAVNIMNQENKLIDANVIDEISNVIANQFSQLLELEFGE